MTPRDRASLIDVVNATRLAQSFVQDMTWDSFVADIKTQSAVLYQIAIMGEAVKRLSPAFREQHPEIDWKAMAGMRDKLIHDYEGVDVERVWRVLQSNLPELLQTITAVLED
ncbi:DUF86 domain-containing protein [Nodosilinea sp. LEGE 07088]|uniref:HepT-like ribonuclease domain-containing protein n=1 Tax=Nodosilinea sp. LEGE 07088 TaxID=2777968 RepID=UPI00188091DF|nr:DUF86 domain-containing protein [Nodosilinea sp. LEGE 07088]MBE9141435.1 DUF86 domain-containing protein [Nodosilinea sp. LEGE 07088]